MMSPLDIIGHMITRDSPWASIGSQQEISRYLL